jgi:type IV secretion system protein VirB9
MFKNELQTLEYRPLHAWMSGFLLMAAACGAMLLTPSRALAAEARQADTISRDVIRFAFSPQQTTTIVCSLTRECNVALQPGEQISSIDMGDTSQWSVKNTTTGSGANAVQHLVLKPLTADLKTRLVIHTDRRDYRMRLLSHQSHYMSKVSFTYPPEKQAQAAPETKTRREPAQRPSAAAAAAPAAAETPAAELSYNYALSGTASWKPVRVYNDGRQTVIELPGALPPAEAPLLLATRREGDTDTAPVNYQVQGHRYVVDTVFDRALLITGAGPNQDRVTIQRGR